MNIATKRVLLLLLVTAIFPVQAADDKAVIKKALAKDIPRGDFSTLRAAPIEGFYEMEAGSDIIYVSKDGRYVFYGNLLDMRERKNLTQDRRGRLVRDLVNSVSDDQVITIGPKSAKHTITVFTDVDCPYCVKLHREVPELNKGGVKVRYMFYPRKGLSGSTYDRSVSVWCAKDRIKAMDAAKFGGKLEKRSCSNPIKQHYELAQRVGVTGTPTIVLENGKVVGGYVPAARLLGQLNLVKANQ